MTLSLAPPDAFELKPLYAPSTRRPSGMNGRLIAIATVPLYPVLLVVERSLMGSAPPPAIPSWKGLSTPSCACETRGAATSAIAGIARNSERFKDSPCSRVHPRSSRKRSRWALVWLREVLCTLPQRVNAATEKRGRPSPTRRQASRPAVTIVTAPEFPSLTGPAEFVISG